MALWLGGSHCIFKDWKASDASTYALKRSWVLLSARYSSTDGGNFCWTSARLYCGTIALRRLVSIGAIDHLGYDYVLKQNDLTLLAKRRRPSGSA